jgi:alkylation response protein AidB-like acyl-CoA dehydrogenase
MATAFAQNRTAPAHDPGLQQVLQEAHSQREVFSRQCRLSAKMVNLLKEAGIYRALVARRFGGDECSPTEFFRRIEQISSVDGSTGWVASFGHSALYLAALPITTLEQLYANGPDVVFAGGIYPPQPAPSVNGGFLVNGRWSWGSGSTGADFVGVGIQTDEGNGSGGLPRIAVLPQAKASIVENWNVNGMKGTGSHDIVVKDIVVPQEWTFIRGGASSIDTPLFQYPSLAIAA